jgi:hypothetical protein
MLVTEISALAARLGRFIKSRPFLKWLPFIFKIPAAPCRDEFIVQLQ